jgi:hypothetical protein
MDTILQGLHDLAGIQGTIVFNAGGQVLYHRSHSIYDLSILTQVSQAVVRGLDSIQLQHEDWDAVTAQFSDGKLLIRKLDTGKGKPAVLAVIADASLNTPFAAVALRVAVNKLKTAIENGALAAAPPTAPGAPITSVPVPGRAPAVAPLAVPSKVELAGSGLSWSELGSSSGGASTVSVSDEASGAFLTRCSKALALNVGPMAKVFVKEAVRKVSPAGPFSMAHASALLNELEVHIDDVDDRIAFRRKAAAG